MEIIKNSFSDSVWKIVEEMIKNYDEVHMVVDALPASVDNVDVHNSIYDSFLSCWEKKMKDYAHNYELNGGSDYEDEWSKLRKVWMRLDGKERTILKNLSLRQCLSLVENDVETAVKIIRLVAGNNSATINTTSEDKKKIY